MLENDAMHNRSLGESCRVARFSSFFGIQGGAAKPHLSLCGVSYGVRRMYFAHLLHLTSCFWKEPYYTEKCTSQNVTIKKLPFEPVLFKFELN